MCGIAAIWTPRAQEDLQTSIRAATRALANRGPDASGTWIDTEARIALGHTRLAILDLTEAGHQPMLSKDGRYCLTYNGEIYNFQDLSAELAAAGHVFAGHSDTEVMLAAFQEWGVEASVSKFTGMFAFALWDRHARTLTLCRDRFGKKPLYFGWNRNSFVVASQLKALRAIPRFKARICQDAFNDYAASGYVSAPLSIYEGIYKLKAGGLLTVDAPMAVSDGRLESWTSKVRLYWDPLSVVHGITRQRYTGSEQDAAKDLISVIEDAVRIRMIADVPVGAFLSGGVDSSIVVALMQRLSHSPVRTYTVGFADPQYDESVEAAAIAQAIGTNHTAIRLSPVECQQVVPMLPEVYDEPFADASAIPTILVSRYACKDVTVALSGDGGDELFGGYNRHSWLPRIWERAETIPKPVRIGIAKLFSLVPPDKAALIVRHLTGKSGVSETRLPSDKFTKALAVLRASDYFSAYDALVRPSASLARGISQRKPRDVADDLVPHGLSRSEELMYLDMTSYLVDDVLVKVDRATMAYGLEARAPFLDHRVAGFAWSLPSPLKVNGQVGKKILRDVRTSLIPFKPESGAKMGFSVPIGDWLRGPLREWAEELLNVSRLKADGFFDADAVTAKWRRHLSGRASHEHDLWRVLMFNAWLLATGPR